MKTNLHVITLLVFHVLSFSCQIKASSLIGTSSVIYKDTPHVFHNGELASGFVALKKGFTVPDLQGVRLNLSVPVSYGMDLRTTGSIVLENNLELDSGFTLSSSGIICGNGYSLILNDDLIIPELSTLTITSTLTIEGNGHTIILDRFAQILTDAHSTLTLRNLVLRNVCNSPEFPPLAAKGTDSKISLDNVKLKIVNNFNFNNGSLFIHNNVLYSANSQLLYTSPQPSYIAPNSTLAFDKSSSFYYLPSTPDTDFFVLQGDTSQLLFDGSSFISSSTGMTLNQGKLTFKNQVSIEGATSILNMTSPGTSKNYGTAIYALDWSPDGNFLAVGGTGAINGAGGFNNQDGLRIYQLDLTHPDFLVAATSMPYGNADGNAVRSVSWSPNGKYLAICGHGASYGVGGFYNSNNIRIYKFDNAAKTLTPFTSLQYESPTETAYSIKWSPDGLYLALGGERPYLEYNSYTLCVYYFDEQNAKITMVAGSYSDQYSDLDLVEGVAWHPSGQYLFACGSYLYFSDLHGNAIVHLYRFDKSNPIFGNRLALMYEETGYGMFKSADWSPDGQFIVAAKSTTSGGASIFVFRFSPTYGIVDFALCGVKYSNSLCARWDVSGHYISYGEYNAVAPNLSDFVTQHYEFNRITGQSFFNETSRQNYSTGGGNIYATAWNHVYTSLIAIGGNNPLKFGGAPNNDELQIYNYASSAQSIATKNIVSTTSSRVYSTDISKDNKYMALGGMGLTPNNIQLYKIVKNTGALTLLDSKSYGSSVSPVTTVNQVALRPNSAYLAVGGTAVQPSGDFNNYDTLRIYKMENDLLTSCTSVAIGNRANNPIIDAMAWHPSGNYLAISAYGAQAGYGGFADNNNVRIYGFDGTNLTPITSYYYGKGTGCVCYAIAWSDDGNYLTMGGYSKAENLFLCKFNDYSTLDLISTNTFGPRSPGITCLDWNMNGNDFLMISGDTVTSGTALRICHFNGTDFTETRSYAGVGPTAQWSPDGRYILTGNTGVARILSFDNNAINSTFFDTNSDFNLRALTWNADGTNFILTGMSSNLTRPSLYEYKINKSVDIVHQRTALSLNDPLNINVLGGANVQISGIVKYNE